MSDPTLKRCSRTRGCGEQKREDEFRRTRSGTHKKVCISCEAAGRRQDKPRAHETVLATNLRRLYGITVEEYAAMLATQEHRCAACGRHESECPPRATGRPRRDAQRPAAIRLLVVDHCHGTEVVRALLCSDCNLAFGILGESAERAEGLLRYAMWSATVAGHTGGPAVLTDTLATALRSMMERDLHLPSRTGTVRR